MQKTFFDIVRCGSRDSERYIPVNAPHHTQFSRPPLLIVLKYVKSINPEQAKPYFLCDRKAIPDGGI